MQYKWIALSITTVGTLMTGIDARIINYTRILFSAAFDLKAELAKRVEF